MPEPSWGIVMTVKEPRALLLTNLAWHLGTGASEIHVYLDDPDDPVATELAAFKQIKVTRCDAGYWAGAARTGERPATIRRRQSINANHAQAVCACDWLIHLDADEFLVQDRPLSEELRYISELDCELFFTPRERIYVAGEVQDSFFTGLFRKTTKGLNRRDDKVVNDKIIFGDHYPLLVHGMLGHSAGKCAVPVRKGFEIGIHWAFRGSKRRRAARYQSTSTHLLHFDGLTPLNWMFKLLRYANYRPSDMTIAPHRLAQIEIMTGIAEDPAQIIEFHAVMKEFDEERLDRLRGFGLLHEHRFDPTPVVRQVLGTVPDLRPEPFDDALTLANPELAAMLNR